MQIFDLQAAQRIQAIRCKAVAVVVVVVVAAVTAAAVCGRRRMTPSRCSTE